MAWPTRVIIDTDPGIDDAVALALAACSSEIEIVAVTTVYGNAGLDATSRNAAHVLALAGRGDVPVRPGSARPLERAADTASERHGPEGVGSAVVPDGPAVAHNPYVLLDLLRSLERPVTLVTLGPLTNLAHALARDRSLVVSRIERHLGAFGSLGPRAEGDRWADFNCWTDPEAAAAVFTADMETVMFGLDVTRCVRMAANTIAQLARSSDPLESWLGAALRFHLQAQHQRTGTDQCAVHDVAPIAALIAPGLVTLAQSTLSVDLGDGQRRGCTVQDDGGEPVTVAVGVNANGIAQLLLRVWRGRE